MNVKKYHKERIRRVCDFININLDQDISLEQLSEVAACSKYHFHRVFKSVMGLSTIQFVLLTRMKRASFRLAFEPKRSIIDIAYEAHFESPEAFSRAFSSLHPNLDVNQSGNRGTQNMNSIYQLMEIILWT